MSIAEESIRTQETIPLSRIKDGGAQMRVEKINPDIVNEYAEAMVGGAVVPPVDLFHDETTIGSVRDITA
jgi:hypothetical protein